MIKASILADKFDVVRIYYLAKDEENDIDGHFLKKYGMEYF